MSDVEDKTASLLTAIWLRSRPIVEERLQSLDRAAAAANDGAMPEALRADAAGSAHKLAGSLGMYGYDKGTRIARQIEQLLATTSTDAAQLQALIAELRAAIFPNG